MNKKTQRNVHRLLLELALAILFALFARNLSVVHAGENELSNVTCRGGLPALPVEPREPDTGLWAAAEVCGANPVDLETIDPR